MNTTISVKKRSICIFRKEQKKIEKTSTPDKVIEWSKKNKCIINCQCNQCKLSIVLNCQCDHCKNQRNDEIYISPPIINGIKSIMKVNKKIIDNEENQIINNFNDKLNNLGIDAIGTIDNIIDGSTFIKLNFPSNQSKFKNLKYVG